MKRTWLQRWRRWLFGPPDKERYVHGWRYAVHCINEGKAAVDFLEMQLDEDAAFGTDNAFDAGARAALRRFKPWLP